MKDSRIRLKNDCPLIILGIILFASPFLKGTYNAAIACNIISLVIFWHMSQQKFVVQSGFSNLIEMMILRQEMISLPIQDKGFSLFFRCRDAAVKRSRLIIFRGDNHIS